MGSYLGGVGKVYQLSSGSWSQLGLDQTYSVNNVTNTNLGLSTSISNDGTRVAFGAPGLFDDETGSVLVLKYTSGNWDYVNNLSDSGGPGSPFGWSSDISNDGSIIAAGNYQNSDGRGTGLIVKLEREN